jgi:O-antigen/teichoic acid export membrane protein
LTGYGALNVLALKFKLQVDGQTSLAMLNFRHILSTTGATVLGGGFQLALTILVAHLLPPEQNGYYSQFVVIFNLVFIALNFGLGPASTYYIASGQAGLRQVTWMSAAVSANVGIVLAVLTTVAWISGLLDMVEQALKMPVSVTLLALVTGYFFLVFNQVLALLMGAHRYDTVNLLNVARSGLALVAVVVAALLSGLDATRISLAHSISLAMLLIASGLVLMLIWRENSGHRSEVLQCSLLKPLLRYGALVYTSNLLHYLAMRGLLLLLSFYSSPASVGFLSMALLLLEVTLLVPSAIGQLVFPQSSTQDFNHQAMESILRINVLTSLMTVVLMMALAIPLVEFLIGAAYAPVAVALLHLSPSVILLAIPRILSQVLSGQGHPRYPLAAAIVSILTGTILAIWAIPRWGVLGAAWVTNLVSAITATITLYGYCKVHNAGWSQLLLPQRQDWVRLRLLIGRLA